MGSRRVYVSGMTTHPDTAWVAQQARNSSVHLAERGEEHLRYIVHEYVDYFNRQRPHQAMDNCPLTDPPETAAPADGEILCQERLGGLLRHYYRKAA